MEQPNPPGIAALGAMTDTLDFVKRMWGNLGVPGMVVPTLSAEDINKKIADLKTVESWLSLNMNMLRGTIQALEVQSGTIAALQSMSAAMGVPKPATAEAPPPFESPFAAPTPTPAHSARSAESSATSAAAPEAPAALPELGAMAANPVAWWNVLQEQFQQAVSHAVAELPASAAAILPAGDAAKPAKTRTPKAGATPAPRRRKPS